MRNEQIGNANGIFNLVRNVGGSIGISVAQTLLTRRVNYHQNEITNHVPRTQEWFQQQANNLSAYLGRHTALANAATASQAQLYRGLTQQAQLWAFVDVFRWISLLCFGCVLIVWFFRKVKPGKVAAGAH